MSSPYGPLKTLFLALQASAFMQGVSLDFGEEKIAASDLPCPRIVMVPRGGPWYIPESVRQEDPEQPGTGALVPLEPGIVQTWGCDDTIEFYLWAKSSDPQAQAIDETDACESLRLLFASALEDQRAMSDVVGNVAHGLIYKPMRQDWVNVQGVNVYGRALKITVVIGVPIVPPPSPDALVTQTDFIMLPLNRVPG
jgi:hypothetical protein